MPAQTVIQLRRDTSANWTSANPVLAAGEAGFDTTENKIKIGDGTSSWNSLDYASGGSGSITVSETAPTEPAEGDLWFNSTNALTYIYYDSFWVDLAPAIAGPTGATGATGATGPEGPAVTSMNASAVVTTTTDKSAGYTLQSSDKNTYIRSTGSAITITVPDVLADGESVNFIQAGAGQITFAGSGVTISSKESKLKTNAQFSATTIVKLGGAYYLVGDLG
jgi:hypothetical protein